MKRDRLRWYYDELRQVGTDFENARLVEHFDRFQGNSDEHSRSQVQRLGLREGSVFIDIGCGPGSYVIAAARMGARVHAVDVSEGMLAQVQARAAAEGLSGVTTHHAGFLTYEHEGEGADAILSITALHHLPDFWKMVALLRVRDMLEPDGLFLLRDALYTFDAADYESGVERWIDNGRPEGEGFTRTDYETHVRDEHSTFGWIVEGMLERAGFEIREKTERSQGVGAEYLCAPV
jgi:cyclopropane fatty-acyl-phospholipid synthase-like methyltransferase